MDELRFYVAESGGYPILAHGVRGENYCTDFYVLDRAYCHRVVGTFPAGTGRGGSHSIAARRARAERLATRLEQEYAT